MKRGANFWRSFFSRYCTLFYEETFMAQHQAARQPLVDVSSRNKLAFRKVSTITAVKDHRRTSRERSKNLPTVANSENIPIDKNSGRFQVGKKALVTNLKTNLLTKKRPLGEAVEPLRPSKRIKADAEQHEQDKGTCPLVIKKPIILQKPSENVVAKETMASNTSLSSQNEDVATLPNEASKVAPTTQPDCSKCAQETPRVVSTPNYEERIRAMEQQIKLLQEERDKLTGEVWDQQNTINNLRISLSKANSLNQQLESQAILYKAKCEECEVLKNNLKELDILYEAAMITIKDYEERDRQEVVLKLLQEEEAEEKKAENSTNQKRTARTTRARRK
jgi:hypothetical protein